MKLTIPSCLKCHSENISEIFYGYPGDMELYLKLVADQKIHPGGCTINTDSTKWHCNNCGTQWGQLSDPDDSFDYDQGSNLDEVYDK
ncbi:MAG: hypothetical protein ACKVN8_07145 [Nitrosarchaeum sp.]